MFERFSKVINTLALLGILGSIPLFFITSFDAEEFIIDTYQVRCIDNGSFITLQGGVVGEPDTWTERQLDMFRDGMRNPGFDYTTQNLNFYCLYYDDIQPYIYSYTLSEDKVAANMRYAEFKKSVIDSVDRYPELYDKVLVDSERQMYVLTNALAIASVFPLILFLLLQMVRIIIVYVVYGEMVWNPLRVRKKSQTKS